MPDADPGGSAGSSVRIARVVALLREFGSLGIGTLAYQGGRLLLSVVAATVLGPAAFGAWVVLSLIVTYGAFVSVGAANGVGREVPFALGAGRPSEAADAEDTGTLLTLAAGVVAAALMLTAGPWVLGGLVPEPRLVSIALAITLGFQQVFLLQQVQMRSRLRFGRAAAQLVVAGVATVGLCGVLIAGGLVALVVGQAFVSVVAVGAGLGFLERLGRPRWRSATARTLVSVGLPIMLAGLAFSLLTTIDRWMVLAFLGQRALGVYGFVGLVLSGALLVPSIVSQQLYPRIAFAHGEGRPAHELLVLARRQGLIAAGFVATIVVPIGIVAVITVETVLTDYREAAVPILIVLSGVLAYSLSSGYGNLLNSIGAQRSYLGVQLFAIAIDVVFVAVLLSSGMGIAGASIGTTAALAVYATVLAVRARQLAARMEPRLGSVGGRPYRDGP